jgi:hypothetical protein
MPINKKKLRMALEMTPDGGRNKLRGNCWSVICGPEQRSGLSCWWVVHKEALRPSSEQGFPASIMLQVG